MRPVGVIKKGKKDKLSYVKLAICPDRPRRHKPLKFLACGVVFGKYLYISNYMKSGWRSRSCGGRISPSPLDNAHGLLL